MKLTAFIEGIGIGALAMFLMDPQAGNRRRAMIRDEVTSQTRKKREAIDVMTRDFMNRAQGIQHRVRGQVDNVRTTVDEKLHGGNGGENGVSGMSLNADFLKEQWNPATCLMMGATGVFMFIFGMGKRGPVGGLMQVGGVAMVAKAFNDTENRFQSGSGQKSMGSGSQMGQDSFMPGAEDGPQFASDGGMNEGEPVTERGQAGML